MNFTDADRVLLVQFLAADSALPGKVMSDPNCQPCFLKFPKWHRGVIGRRYVVDIAIDALDGHMSLWQSDEYVPGELQAVLMAMVEMPHGYDYLWLEPPNGSIVGPANRLWNVVKRLGRETLNQLDSLNEPMETRLVDLLAKVAASRSTERSGDMRANRAVAKALRGHKRHKQPKRRAQP